MDENIKIKEMFEGTENLLYHYTSFNSAIKIIESEKLLYSKLSKLNDPLESHRPFYYNDPSKIEIIQNKTSKYHQISLTQDTVCQRGFAINAMWGHYADKGYGVCLAFDKKQLLGQLKGSNISHDKIQYSANYDNSIIVEVDVSKCFKRKIDELFFQKSEDWSYEQEYRIIKVIKKNEEDSINISRSLIAIIMYNSNSVKECDSVFGSLEYSILKKIADKTILEYGSFLGQKNLRAEDGSEIWKNVL